MRRWCAACCPVSVRPLRRADRCIAACYSRPMRQLSLLLALLWASAVYAEASTFLIDADRWATPRSGQALVEMEPLRNAVNELMRRPGSRMVIRYPGGEAGQLWVQELRAWLVALGVSSSRIELVPGGVEDNIVQIQVDS